MDVYNFSLDILGRTIEHLGTQMYKQRTVAITELVANCWDACAKNVFIDIPTENKYNKNKSKIIITDDGFGMDADEIQLHYLVVGRNRRIANSTNMCKRKIMGKKGIGKLAGFGFAHHLTVKKKKNRLSNAIEFSLDVDQLKDMTNRGTSIKIPGKEVECPLENNRKSGTIITLEILKHKTPINLTNLEQALSRRFSRTVKGQMKIFINDLLISEPSFDIDYKVPEDCEWQDLTLDDGNKVKYNCVFTKKPIKDKELRGFTIYANERTAQAPNFYFEMETKIPSPHGTKYLSGEIIADFLDDFTDEDLISTDRQEIDWDDDRVYCLKNWGESLIRELISSFWEKRGEDEKNKILALPDIKKRIERLDITSQKQVTKFIKIVTKAEDNEGRLFELSDSLIKAYEYQHFHDFISSLENIENDPEQVKSFLLQLNEWQVLESRALLEIIKGRINIIERFHQMVVNNAPETKSARNLDNMHDLLAGFPWILNPEWNIFSEEKTLSTQLKLWGREDLCGEDTDDYRYDFLALSDNKRLAIIEIKRANYPVNLKDLQALDTYKERLQKAHSEELFEIIIHGGNLDISLSHQENYKKRSDFQFLTWKQIYNKTKMYYQQYRAILDGDIHSPDFIKNRNEVIETRRMINEGIHRGPKRRKTGIGSNEAP